MRRYSEGSQMKWLLQAFMLTLIMLPYQVFAGDDYKCKIERISLASGDQGNSYDMYVKNYVGEEFTVLRSSGLMAGPLKNSYVTTPKVIDFGSTENSHKVVTTMTKEQGAGAGSNIYTLIVLEYEKGPNKPFVFLENDVVFFGICSHF